MTAGIDGFDSFAGAPDRSIGAAEDGSIGALK